MNCQDARGELAALLPREAPGDSLGAHLARCAACRAAADRLAAVDARLDAHFGRLAPRPDFDARLRAAIARAEAERRAAGADRPAPDEIEPARRLLRAGSILDGIAALGIGATVIGLAVQSHETLERWLEVATSGQLGAVATSGTLVIGTLTAAAVGVVVAGAARWIGAMRI